MNLSAILEQFGSALAGGAVTGFSAWLAINVKVGKLEERINGLSKTVDQCQDEREICRSSMRAHHENPGLHVETSMIEALKDIRARLIRIENKMMNNGGTR